MTSYPTEPGGFTLTGEVVSNRAYYFDLRVSTGEVYRIMERLRDTPVGARVRIKNARRLRMCVGQEIEIVDEGK